MGKNKGPILNLLWTKVHDILRRYRGPIVVCNALARLRISYVDRKIEAVILPLSCEVVEKGGFWAPGLQEEGIPQISDMHF